MCSWCLADSARCYRMKNSAALTSILVSTHNAERRDSPRFNRTRQAPEQARTGDVDLLPLPSVLLAKRALRSLEKVLMSPLEMKTFQFLRRKSPSGHFGLVCLRGPVGWKF